MFFTKLKALLFKNRCVICEKKVEAYDVCPCCFEKIHRVSSVKKEQNLYYFLVYNDYYKKLIYSYKYNSLKGISKVYNQLFHSKLLEILAIENIDCIIPVPIHEKRLQARGFNQVEEILKQMHFSYSEVIRKKNTKAMHGIQDRQSRESNIANSFDIPSSLELTGKSIALVDDIYTTGATLKELENCIRRHAQVKKIIYVTFFKARKVK